MADNQLSPILTMFDNYVSLIENPTLISQINNANVSTAFACSRFIEKAISRAKDDGKMEELVSHLHAHWSMNNRVNVYSIESLENACDKFVEVMMKTPAVECDVVDKLLTLYVNDCGVVRLNKFLELLFNESLIANATLECMSDFDLNKTRIEDEGRIFIWHKQAAAGNHSAVLECIDKMIDDGFIQYVLEGLVKLGEKSAARKLIVQSLSRRINDYSEDVCEEVFNARKNVLRILNDDLDFRLNYVDAIFYFGRNMTYDYDKECWTGDHRFSFDDIVGSIRGLMSLDDDIFVVVRNRISAAKEMVGGRIWEDVEVACVDE